MNSTLSYYKQDSSERLSFRRLTLNDVELWSRFFENNDRENFLGPVNSELTNFQKAKKIGQFQINCQILSFRLFMLIIFHAKMLL